MNIYVSHLSYEVSESDLKTLFSEFGDVCCATVVSERISGQSRGFGFVEMMSEKAGKKAIKFLHEKEVQGRTIIVMSAHEKIPGYRNADFHSRNLKR